MHSAPYSVLLVEDDVPTRERLANSVAEQSELELLAAVGTVAEARSHLEQATPDVLLTDLGLPDGNGVELIRELRQKGAPTQVMVVTVFGDETTR